MTIRQRASVIPGALALAFVLFLAFVALLQLPRSPDMQPTSTPLPAATTTAPRSSPTSVPHTAAWTATRVPVGSPPPAASPPPQQHLPTVTPPAPGEPTLPATALAMQAAATATPTAPRASPSAISSHTGTPTPIPIGGYSDAPMVEVPAGTFLMGVTEDEALGFYRQWYTAYPPGSGWMPLNFSNQTPQLAVYLDRFSIDQLEVTNRDYARCVEAQLCSYSNSGLATGYGIDPRYASYPALVTWSDAVTYCQWVGKRLPSEAEWEKAARGTDARPFPWGSTWRQNALASGYDPEAVGSHPQDQSPYGALDMAGNAPEWTSASYQPYPGNPRASEDYSQSSHVVRGGRREGYLYSLLTVREGLANWQLAGFRCAQGTPPPPLDQAVVEIHAYPTPASTTVPDLDRMVYVPAGEFLMGLDVPNEPLRANEGPVHVVALDAYYIDRYEVTVAQFARFLNAVGGHKWRCGFDCIRTIDGEQPWGLEIAIRNGRYVPGNGYEELPVTIATWDGAQAYCRWAGKQLPSEAEWEKAARGTDGRLYPWGNVWDPSRPAGALWDLRSSAPPVSTVGSYPGDVSPYGAYDMLGNVPEWVADRYDPHYYFASPHRDPRGPDTGSDHVVRGTYGRGAQLGITYRRPASAIIGVRCAYKP